MARSRARTPRPSPQSPPPITGVGPEPTGDFTGRYLVLLRDDGIKEGLQAVQGATGLSEVCNAADFTSVEMAQANEADVFVLDKLKVAVVDADPTQVSGLRSAASEDGAILAVADHVRPGWSDRPVRHPVPVRVSPRIQGRC